MSDTFDAPADEFRESIDNPDPAVKIDEAEQDSKVRPAITFFIPMANQNAASKELKCRYFRPAKPVLRAEGDEEESVVAG